MTLAQIAKDFGSASRGLTNWLHAADVDAGARPGMTAEQAGGNQELRKRVRLLEQENEGLRRAAAHLSQANLPENDVPPRL